MKLSQFVQNWTQLVVLLGCAWCHIVRGVLARSLLSLFQVLGLVRRTVASSSTSVKLFTLGPNPVDVHSLILFVLQLSTSTHPQTGSFTAAKPPTTLPPKRFALVRETRDPLVCLQFPRFSDMYKILFVYILAMKGRKTQKLSSRLVQKRAKNTLKLD